MIVYRAITSDDYPAVQRLLKDNGWANRVSNVERFRKMIEGADRAVVAVEGTCVVGFARALCDDASNGYISMVAVAEDHRRQGIGRQLVEHLIQDDNAGDITWVLRAGRGSRGFWEQLGFVSSEIAMERVRRD